MPIKHSRDRFQIQVINRLLKLGVQAFPFNQMDHQHINWKVVDILIDSVLPEHHLQIQCRRQGRLCLMWILK